jgi:hypothetical protein
MLSPMLVTRITSAAQTIAIDSSNKAANRSEYDLMQIDDAVTVSV